MVSISDSPFSSTATPLSFYPQTLSPHLCFCASFDFFPVVRPFASFPPDHHFPPFPPGPSPTMISSLSRLHDPVSTADSLSGLGPPFSMASNNRPSTYWRRFYKAVFISAASLGCPAQQHLRSFPPPPGYRSRSFAVSFPLPKFLPKNNFFHTKREILYHSNPSVLLCYSLSIAFQVLLFFFL